MKLTYEQRDQNTRNFNAVIMPAIVAELGKHFSAAVLLSDNRLADGLTAWCRTVDLGTPEGHSLFFRYDSYKHRIEISGHWPKSRIPNKFQVFTPGDYIRFTDRADFVLEISVSAGKAPAKIVEDIKRRLLPDYFKAHAILRMRRDEHDATITANNSLAARLAGILGTKTHASTGNRGDAVQDRVSLPNNVGYGSIEIRSSGAFFKLDITTAEQAVKLAEFIKTL